MENPTNWELLGDRGVEMRSSINGRSVDADHLDLEVALRIAHALTLKLDETERRNIYAERSFPFEDVVSKARQQIKEGKHLIFDETRPADANCAVRVEIWRPGEYFLLADVRNDYVDRPELDRPMRLQHAFTEVIESLDLPPEL